MISSTAGADRGQAAGEHLLLSRTIMHRLTRWPVAGRAWAATRLARRARSGSARASRPAGRGLAPAAQLLEIALEVGQPGVEPLGGSEQRAGGVEAPQLVQGDPEVVEQYRLARLALEHAEGAADDGEEQLDVREPEVWPATPRPHSSRTFSAW